jgi:excisionase family DNA binding protein
MLNDNWKKNSTFPSVRNPEVEPVWEIADAADFLHLHPKTIYRMVRAGELPGAQIGNRWRFRPSDLDAWLRSKVISPGTPRRQ